MVENQTKMSPQLTYNFVIDFWHEHSNIYYIRKVRLLIVIFKHCGIRVVQQ